MYRADVRCRCWCQRRCSHSLGQEAEEREDSKDTTLGCKPGKTVMGRHTCRSGCIRMVSAGVPPDHGSHGYSSHQQAAIPAGSRLPASGLEIWAENGRHCVRLTSLNASRLLAVLETQTEGVAPWLQRLLATAAACPTGWMCGHPGAAV
eukprot:scaffold69684_cov31-Tisochrysis_lutea.AAC.1